VIRSNFTVNFDVRKLRVLGLSCGIICVILCFAVLIQYLSVTDTHTDTRRHTTTAYTTLSIASCGKNQVKSIFLLNLAYFQMWWIFAETRQRILKCTYLQVLSFFYAKFSIFWYYHIDFLSIAVAELSTLKNGPFFGPPCMYEAGNFWNTPHITHVVRDYNLAVF